ESAMVSVGLRSFSAPLFCAVGNASCANATMDGYWKATVIAKDGSMREVQMGHAEVDMIASRGAYHQVFGAFLPVTDTIHQGDVVRFDFIGKLPGSATDWTMGPLIANCRYRSFSNGQAGPWTVLEDAQVQPLNLTAEPAKYVRAIAPMDVQTNVPF